MAGHFEGKVALVTGASSGIGAATAAALAREGARVAVSARRIERLQALARDLKVDDTRIRPIRADIQDEADAEALIKETLDWGGRLDILVNNAGLSRGGALENVSLADLRVVLDTNVFALINLCRLAIPALKAAQGDIVNIASTIAKSLNANSSVYGCSKAAVVGFSEALRKELCEEGVRVMTVSPGIVETEFMDGVDEAKRAGLLAMVASIGPLQSQDVAETIAFALSRPRHVTLNEIVIRPTRQA